MVSRRATPRPVQRVAVFLPSDCRRQIKKQLGTRSTVALKVPLG